MSDHDAHVLKFKMQFFPTKFFIVYIFFFLMVGVLLGYLYGSNSCYLFASLAKPN
jgi:hypothetical protein